MARKKYKGTVYLIHFSAKFHHAQHYIGYTKDRNVDRRIERHRKGHGAKLLAALNRSGVRYWINRVWFNVDQGFERRLKNRKGTPSFCPTCNAKAFLCKVAAAATEQKS